VKLDQTGKVARSTKPRTPAEMQKIQQIVATAVGLDATRGDQITVENVAFDDTSEPTPEPTFMERYGDGVVQNLAPIVVLILGLAGLMLVVRPIVRGVFPPREKKAAAPTETAPLPAAAAPMKTIEEIEGEIEAQLDAKTAPQLQDRKTPVLQRRVAKVVTDEPENAARLVRSWLLEDKV
jgi:flagellar M-ring protein FliF